MKKILLSLLFLLAFTPEFASALVSVYPSSLSLNICPYENFSINITLSGVAGVYNYQYDLLYDSNVLEIVSVSEGNVLNSNGDTTLCQQPDISTAGLINDISCVKTSNNNLSLSDGILTMIIFRLRGISTFPALSNLSLNNLQLLNNNNNQLNNTKQDGQVVISSCPCVENDIDNCIAENGCAGNQTCSGGNWSACITSTPYACDSNCDGNIECLTENCTSCQCIIGVGSNNCTGAYGCPGTQPCVNGSLGECKMAGYFCDSNCDGTSECSVVNCTSCQCLSPASRSCRTSGGCDGRISCVNGNWSDCRITHYYCDYSCDGVNETCSDTPCPSTCVCVEDWDCDAWSTCSGGTQVRTCSDLNACGTDDSKPSLTRTCSTGSTSDSAGGSSSGSSSSGSGDSLPPSCTEAWSCDAWSSCQTDGFSRRVCSDASNCGTFQGKPQELQTCFYEGSCDDGIMNRDELGVDCGGSCPMICLGPEPEQIALGPPILKIIAEPVSAEILDQYVLKVTVENQGQSEANDLSIVASKWSGEPQVIQSIMPGMSEQRELVLSLPPNLDENFFDIQLIQGDAVIDIQTVPVTLSVPQFSVKINKDIDGGRTYESIIVDNRNNGARTVEVDVTINKGRETYLFDFDKTYDLAENEIFNKVDYLYQDLPNGKYEVHSVFYENGQKVGEATSYVTLSGGNKSVNVQYLFYLLLLAIVGVSGHVFFLNQKKLKGELNK